MMEAKGIVHVARRWYLNTVFEYRNPSHTLSETNARRAPIIIGADVHRGNHSI